MLYSYRPTFRTKGAVFVCRSDQISYLDSLCTPLLVLIGKIDGERWGEVVRGGGGVGGGVKQLIMSATHYYVHHSYIQFNSISAANEVRKIFSLGK